MNAPKACNLTPTELVAHDYNTMNDPLFWTYPVTVLPIKKHHEAHTWVALVATESRQWEYR